MDTDTELLTLHQVAERLQVPYDVVRKAVYAGRWPHVRISERNRRMSQTDVDRVVTMLHHEPKPQTRSDARRRSARVADYLKAV